MRLFLAFELPEEVRARIGERVGPLRATLPTASWVPPDRLHLTLAFLGEVEEERLAVLDAAVAPVFAGRPRLAMRLDGAGTFPPRRPARVAWIGVAAQPGGELEMLEGHARQALARAPGVLEQPLEDRPYHAHVTVARPRRPWNQGAVDAFRSACDGLAGEWEAGRAVLLESHLGGRGARYEMRREYPLGTTAPDGGTS